MSLSLGTKLGPYEIVSALGAGGMGEVYRAHDPRLGRSVAIKVLPSHLSSDPDLKLRFEREARAISKFSHPHICTLYDVGSQEGTDYLVMEYVEGETLEQRLAKSPLPPTQAMTYGVQIADALDKAHRHGIIHRDLKPGNVMLTKSGAKLLDFGLAKLREEPSPVAAALTEMTVEGERLTAEGMLVGTFQYMAPEQMEGKQPDTRSDIFALGAVLYEMLTGKAAFSGKTKASIIAAILSSDPPPLSNLQPLAPPALERAVKQCLAKDPDERWQSAGDIARELKWIAESGSQTGIAPQVSAKRKTRERLAWTMVGACAVLTLALLLAYLHVVSVRPPVLISSILPPAGTRFAFGSEVAKISPDGRMLLFVATDADGIDRLWVRSVDSPSARPLPGTEGAAWPFWSADSRSIGFFADGNLKTVQATGGPVVSLHDVSFASGGTWNQYETILFETGVGSGIYQIPASGGSARLVLSLDKSKFNSYGWPNFLPDGKHFTYSAWGNEAYTGTYFASIDGRENKLVTNSTGNTAFSSGFLLYGLSTGSTVDLMAEAFDPAKGRVKGEPQLIVRGIEYLSGPDVSSFAVSDRLLIYDANPTGAVAVSTIAWLDRSGKRLSAVTAERDSFDLRLSPDGQRMAYSKGGPNSDIWIQELKRDVPMRLTFDPSVDKGAPTWSPDGSEVLFDIAPGGKTPPGIYRKSSSGTGGEELLAQPNETSMTLWPTDWSRDGRFVLCVEGEIISRTHGEIWALPTMADRKPRVLIRAPGAAYDGQFSPDGHWVAYVSRESGREEVYVVPFDGNQVLSTPPLQEVAITRRWQVSAKGGAFPRWRRDGKELFYVGPGSEFMAIKIEAKGNAFSVSEARPLFRQVLANGVAFPYDVSSDGQRFLVNSFGENQTSPTLIVDWMELLKNK